MDDVKDYRIEVRLKNNRILRLIERAGYQSVAEFCRAHQFREGDVGSLINMKLGAFSAKSAEFRPIVLAMSLALGVSPYDLFNERQAAGDHTVTFISREVDAPETFIADNSTPEIKLIRDENLRAIESALGSLTPREERVLRLHFGIAGREPLSLEEIGQQLCFTRERVRQIIEKGLRKLRRPASRRRLRDVFEHELHAR